MPSGDLSRCSNRHDQDEPCAATTMPVKAFISSGASMANDQASCCYERAASWREMALRQYEPVNRVGYLSLARHWQLLAESYEIAERTSQAIEAIDHMRRDREADRAMSARDTRIADVHLNGSPRIESGVSGVVRVWFDQPVEGAGCRVDLVVVFAVRPGFAFVQECLDPGGRAARRHCPLAPAPRRARRAPVSSR